MNTICLSTVGVGLKPKWAWEAVGDVFGIEHMCHKTGPGCFEEGWVRRYRNHISALHGSFHAVTGYKHDIAESGLLRKWEMNRWLVKLGGIEDPGNPTLGLARQYGIPVVVHAGIILELRESGIDPAKLFEGIHIRLEGNDKPHYLNGGEIDGLELAAELRPGLVEAGLEVGYTADLEHIAYEIGFTGDADQYMDGFSRIVGLLGPALESVHVCDYDPTVAGFKGGQHLLPGKGKLPLARIFRYLNEHYPNLEYVLEATGGVRPFVAAYVFGLGRKRAVKNAKDGLDFISRHRYVG